MQDQAIKNGKQQAFPQDWGENGYDNGLTKREYFAAIALQGLLASYAGLDQNPQPQEAAQRSINFADALLLELERPSQ